MRVQEMQWRIPHGERQTERIDSEGNFTFVCQVLRLLPNDLRPPTKYVLGAGALLLYELMR